MDVRSSFRTCTNLLFKHVWLPNRLAKDQDCRGTDAQEEAGNPQRHATEKGSMKCHWKTFQMRVDIMFMQLKDQRKIQSIYHKHVVQPEPIVPGGSCFRR